MRACASLSCLRQVHSFGTVAPGHVAFGPLAQCNDLKTARTRWSFDVRCTPYGHAALPDLIFLLLTQAKGVRSWPTWGCGVSKFPWCVGLGSSGSQIFRAGHALVSCMSGDRIRATTAVAFSNAQFRFIFVHNVGKSEHWRCRLRACHCHVSTYALNYSASQCLQTLCFPSHILCCMSA